MYPGSFVTNFSVVELPSSPIYTYGIQPWISRGLLSLADRREGTEKGRAIFDGPLASRRCIPASTYYPRHCTVYICVCWSRESACLVCVGILYKVQTHACRRVHRNIASSSERRLCFLLTSGEWYARKTRECLSSDSSRDLQGALPQVEGNQPTISFDFNVHVWVRMKAEEKKKKEKLFEVHLCKRSASLCRV